MSSITEEIQTKQEFNQNPADGLDITIQQTQPLPVIPSSSITPERRSRKAHFIRILLVAMITFVISGGIGVSLDIHKWSPMPYIASILPSSAHPEVVHGTVYIYGTSLTVPNAAIQVERANKTLLSTSTNSFGEFSFNVPSDSIIHITVPGYDPVSTGVQPYLTITLTPSAESVAQRFMTAMLAKNWGQMWDILAPNEQNQWVSETDFTHFEQAKFGQLDLTSFALSQSTLEKNWRDPHTTDLTPNITLIDSSLIATEPDGLLSGPSNQALSQGLLKDCPLELAPVNGLWRVLVAGPADQDAPILVPAVAPAVQLTVPIMMYHHVANRPIPASDALDLSLTVKTPDFNQQLSYLQSHGYQTITQTELFDAFYYGKALPAHPIILSFDDGYEDMYTDALPLLLKYHDRGVFYIITGMIGGRYLSWDQVQKMDKDGMEISSHTVHHVNVGSPPAWTTMETEIGLSKHMLETVLGHPVQFFCYPSGEPFHHDSQAQQQTVLTLLFNDGYVGATLDPTTLKHADQNAQTPYQLPRIRVEGRATFAAFVFNLHKASS